jgi:RNA polymerase sigma-70 factor, ECF subfamily
MDTLTSGGRDIGSNCVKRPVDASGRERLSAGSRSVWTTDRTMDESDIRDCLAGNGDAFEALVKRHQDRISARMWRFTRNEYHHADLVQEVFVQAYLSLGTFRGDAPFEHWLTRIATIVGYKYWKKLSRERSRHMIPLDEIKNLAQQDPENIDPGNASTMLHGLMQRLAPRDRLVLMLRYVEDRSVRQTAQLTGWTQSMVKVQAWRARKKLRKLLRESGLEVD